MATTRERRERRAERLEEWADKRDAKSKAGFAKAHEIADGIPFGQPILVGHHSEGRARRDQARIESGMRQGVESAEMADRHRQKAQNIRSAAAQSIYRDDVDEVERIERKLADLESQRDRRKAFNVAVRKRAKLTRAEKRLLANRMIIQDDEREAFDVAAKKAVKALAEQVKEDGLDKAELRDLEHALRFSGTVGYPSYSLSNLSARIRKYRKRLDEALARREAS